MFVLALLGPAASYGQARRHDGFVGQLHLGLGWCTDDACDEDNAIDAKLGTGASFGMFLGYRFPTPYVGVGANWQYSLHPVDDDENWAEDAEAHSFAFDFGARAHPLVRGPFDPWVGLGIGYAFAGSSWDNTQIDRSESSSLDGPAFVFSVGGDYWLSDRFAVGLAIRYMLVFWSELCLETEYADLRWPDDTCAAPDEWDDRGLFVNLRGARFSGDDLPDLVQFLLTGTFAP